MKFIVPLKHSDKGIDYGSVMADGISGMEVRFSFEGCNIWYYSRKAEGRDMFVYLDARLREKENDDFLRRMESNVEKKPENRDELYAEEAHRDKCAIFGTLAIITNSGKEPENEYVDYKSRCNDDRHFQERSGCRPRLYAGRACSLRLDVLGLHRPSLVL